VHNQTRFYIYDVAAARDQALEGYQSQPCRTAGSQKILVIVLVVGLISSTSPLGLATVAGTDM